MPSFEDAVVDSKKLTSKPSNDDLLQLYGSSYFIAKSRAV
jgi:diazepam-binding inhibitor (GABA receptor modulating acyl-CoA-binding protein)